MISHKDCVEAGLAKSRKGGGQDGMWGKMIRPKSNQIRLQRFCFKGEFLE